MDSFTFQNPTKIIFGKGTIPQIGAEAKTYGTKGMLVYGRSSIKKSGVFDTVKKSCAGAGVKIVEFGGVRPNPVLSHARKGIQLAKKEKVQFILGVGGGSVVDCSKAIAAGAKARGNVWDFFTGKAKMKDALPVLAVLTLPATSSEMNDATVITDDEETKQKIGFRDPALYPKVSILDPTTTYTVPLQYTAYAAVDVISHLIEGYFTCKDPWTPVQDRFTEGQVRTIIECYERIAKNPEDWQGRSTFMWAATIAWNGLVVAGVGAYGVPMHMLEHPLSALYDIAHGAGLAVVIPAWLSWAAKKDPSKMAQFAEAVFDIRSGSTAKKAAKGIAALKGWFNKIGSPTSFKAANIPGSDIPRIADNARELALVWGMKDYTKAVIEELYRLCL